MTDWTIRLHICICLDDYEWSSCYRYRKLEKAKESNPNCH